MKNIYDPNSIVRETYRTPRSITSGLRTYMQHIFKLMGLGLGITGFTAFFSAQSPELAHLLYVSPLKWVILLAPVGLAFYLSASVNRLSYQSAQLLFWTYSALMGLSLGSVFLIYTSQSIARVFFITSSMFLFMSLYGYTTKKDLTSMGAFLTMGLIGIIIASLVNLFFQSSGIHFVTSFLAVAIFTGLTAYDVQRIKDLYYDSAASSQTEKVAIMAALTLYLDFINLFISLLRFFGDRKN